MRAVKVLMVASVVGLIALGVLYGRRFIPNLPAYAARLGTSTSPSANVQPDLPDHPKATRAAKRHRSSGHGNVVASMEEPILTGTTVVVVPVPAPLHPDNHTLGLSRSELREQYGAPTLRFAATNDGGLLERYYYRDSGHEQMVVATLRDGRVVSVQKESD